MKLFHTENGRKVVYVQMEDIMHLYHSDMPIPASIFTKVFKGIVIVDNSNRFDFVRFDKESEVEFFRKLEFVLDYGRYKDYTGEQLQEEYEEIVKKANDIGEKWNHMTEEQREQNMELIQEYENLEYMLLFLTEICAVKYGKRKMPFPDFVEISEKPQKKSFFSRFKDYFVKKNVK